MAISTRKQRAFTLYTVILIMLFGIGGFFIVKKLKYSDVQYLGDYTESMFVPDEITGYKAAAGQQIHSLKLLKEDTVYNVTYTIDGNGHRLVPSIPTATEHCLFFGCSFTFGEGLPDSVTVPYLFSERSLGDEQVYNLALQGYGPQQMLRLLSSGRVAQWVSQPTGVAYYILLPEHIYRVIGAPYVMYGWGASMPCYEMLGDSLIDNGSFASARPVKNIWYKALGFTGLLQIPAIGYPKISADDIELTAEVISTSKKVYLEQFPGSQFKVVCYPSSWINKEYQELTKALQGKGVELMDLRGVFALDSNFTIKGDGHPNAFANSVVTSAILGI